MPEAAPPSNLLLTSRFAFACPALVFARASLYPAGSSLQAGIFVGTISARFRFLESSTSMCRRPMNCSCGYRAGKRSASRSGGSTRGGLLSTAASKSNLIGSRQWIDSPPQSTSKMEKPMKLDDAFLALRFGRMPAASGLRMRRSWMYLPRIGALTPASVRAGPVSPVIKSEICSVPIFFEQSLHTQQTLMGGHYETCYPTPRVRRRIVLRSM